MNAQRSRIEGPKGTDAGAAFHNQKSRNSGDNLEKSRAASENPRREGGAIRVFDPDRPAIDSADIMLRQAFQLYWLPVNEYLVGPSKPSEYRTALAHWEAFCRGRASCTRTGAPDSPPAPRAEPPISQIDCRVLNEFGAWLLSPTGGGLRQSTVSKIAAQLHSILRSVGPRDRRHQSSPELIDSVPTMAPVRRLAGGVIEQTNRGRNLTDAELGAIYEACDVATWPQEQPTLHWRTFLVFTSLLAPRAGDASRMTAEAFTLGERSPGDGRLSHRYGWVEFVASKTGKTHLAPLPPAVHAHVSLLIRRRGGHLYQWVRQGDRSPPYKQRPWVRTWKAIAAQAGIADLTRKDLRVTANNKWNRVRDGLGDWLLGHSARGVNDRHYRDRLLDAIDAAVELEVPPQFQTPAKRSTVQMYFDCVKP